MRANHRKRAITMTTQATFAVKRELRVDGRTGFLVKSREPGEMIDGQNPKTSGENEKDVFEKARTEFFELNRKGRTEA